jgi:hypothetical protein
MVVPGHSPPHSLFGIGGYDIIQWYKYLLIMLLFHLISGSSRNAKG